MTTINQNPVRRWVGGSVAIVIVTLIFIVPFIFIFLTASKNKTEAAERLFTWPTEWKIFDNFLEVIERNNYLLPRAVLNSLILTVCAVALITVFSAMVGYVLQRRRSGWNKLVNFLVLAGLIIPAAVVPTIWVLQGVGLFKTMPGLILVHVAFGLPFSILLFTAFMSTIPRDLDEAAIIDGAGPFKLFFRVIFPLMRPVTVTIVVVQSVFVFNNFDFALYFLPGDENATVQLTLYNYQAQSVSAWNLLFMCVLVITVPLLIMYIIFNRQIVAGMTSGAVKG
jgi:raffinose/stachyose/melibiose transport system permease protein